MDLNHFAWTNYADGVAVIYTKRKLARARVDDEGIWVSVVRIAHVEDVDVKAAVGGAWAGRWDRQSRGGTEVAHNVEVRTTQLWGPQQAVFPEPRCLTFGREPNGPQRIAI